MKSQSLASDLTKAESALVTSQIDVEQNTDLNEIEAYAKQKLGMQKPDKNQTIYVDTSKTNNSVELQDESTFFQEIGDKISQFLVIYLNKLVITRSNIKYHIVYLHICLTWFLFYVKIFNRLRGEYICHIWH